LGERDRVLDQRLVVGCDRGEAVGAERRLQQPDVRGVDVALARVGDLRRLEVGALDEAQVGREREQRREVALGTE